VRLREFLNSFENNSPCCYDLKRSGTDFIAGHEGLLESSDALREWPETGSMTICK
jgi:hypothetical protein